MDRNRKKKDRPLTALETQKLEIARDLGLEEKIQTLGWAELTAEESGRIGGILSGKRRALHSAERMKSSGAVQGAGAERICWRVEKGS